MKYVGLNVDELLNYIGYNTDFEIDELYKYIYRETDAFDSFSIDLFVSQIKIWERDINEIPEYPNNIKVIYNILESGNTQEYAPEMPYLTDRDINDLRVALEYITPLIEGKYVFGETGEGLNPIPEERERGCKLLKPIYEKYKDFAFDVKALNSIGNIYNPNNNRLFFIKKLFELWNDEAGPFLRIFSKQEDIINHTNRNYTKELIELFHGNMRLLDGLIGKSDDEIASLIGKWARTKDDENKPLIENPQNNLKSKFAQELKRAGFIKCTENTFRTKL